MIESGDREVRLAIKIAYALLAVCLVLSVAGVYGAYFVKSDAPAHVSNVDENRLAAIVDHVVATEVEDRLSAHMRETEYGLNRMADMIDGLGYQMAASSAP